MYLIRILFISIYLISGIFHGISGYFISILSLMYIINALFINLNLSIIYIVLGISCFLLCFKLPKKYILNLNLLNKDSILNMDNIYKEKYIVYQKRLLFTIGLYMLYIGFTWLLTNDNFLGMAKSIFSLDITISCLTILSLANIVNKSK